MATESVKPGQTWFPVFIGLFFLAVISNILAARLSGEVAANHFYAEGRCLLLDKRVAEDPDPTRYKGATNGVYRPECLIRYTVDGREYEKWAYDSFEYYTAWRWPKERMLERFTVGEMYPCWHDPEDPSQVVVVRGYSFLTYVFAALFVATAGLTAWGAVRRFAGVAPEPVAESTPAPVRVPTDSGQPSKGGPWVSPSVWVLWSMFIGGAIGSWGYDPETAPEFFDGVLSQFVRFATVGAICVGVQVLLMPIIFRINEGRFDWRRALTGAAQWTLCWTVFGVIAFAGLGIYRYIGAVSGGWEGGVLATVVGGVIGAAFSVCMTYVAARLTMVEHSGSPQRSG